MLRLLVEVKALLQVGREQTRLLLLLLPSTSGQTACFRWCFTRSLLCCTHRNQKIIFLNLKFLRAQQHKLVWKKNSVVDPHHVGSETFSRIRADKLKILFLIWGLLILDYSNVAWIGWKPQFWVGQQFYLRHKRCRGFTFAITWYAAPHSSQTKGLRPEWVLNLKKLMTERIGTRLAAGFF